MPFKVLYLHLCGSSVKDILRVCRGVVCSDLCDVKVLSLRCERLLGGLGGQRFLEAVFVVVGGKCLNLLGESLLETVDVVQ